jgi:hypothetical protein
MLTRTSSLTMPRIQQRHRLRATASGRPVLHGATPPQATKAIAVTFLMNGGAATVYGARAFAAFAEFYAERAGGPTGSSPPPGDRHSGFAVHRTRLAWLPATLTAAEEDAVSWRRPGRLAKSRVADLRGKCNQSGLSI